MTRKKTSSRKKTTARKKTVRKKTASKRVKRHYPKIIKHGKTAAERRKYIAYREDVEKLKKKYW
ncbi:MAG: hypothetical protein KGK07_15180 [Chloroflexota bacterium]|nr:hypothetical protein [Chloroflexota bacterium]